VARTVSRILTTGWKNLGADRETGEDRRVELEAEDEASAMRASGERGRFGKAGYSGVYHHQG
jgi:hypothetical protein